MISRSFLTLFFTFQITIIHVSSDSSINNVADSYSIPPSSPPLTNNDQVFNPPSQNYNAPALSGSYGSYGSGSTTNFGGGPVTSSVPSSMKFNFHKVLLGFKVMILYVLFVLYKLTYLTDFPIAAASANYLTNRSLDLDTKTVTHEFVTQLLNGNFNPDKLFKGIKQ